MTKPKSVSKQSKAKKSRVSAVKRRAANVPASQRLLDAQEALARMRVELVPLALIDEDPGNRQGEPVTNESVEGLAQTIRWAYMGEPVKLRPSENGRYQLWDGHRRFRAHQVLGLEKIAAIVREDWSELDAVLGTILNVQRQPLDPWSEALAVKAARDLMEGVTAETLAERLGLPVARVKVRLALADLPERVALALVEHDRHDGDSVGIVRSVLGAPNAPTVGDEESRKKTVDVVADFIERQGYVNEYAIHDALVKAFDGYDVTSYDFRPVRDRAPLKRAIQRLEKEGKLLVTTRRKEKVVLALDGAVVDEALEEIQKADEERARTARESAGGVEEGVPEVPAADSAPSRQKEDLREREVMALFRQRVSSMLVRAVKARVSDVGEDAFFALLCRFVDEHCTVALHAADALAHELGVPLRDVAWRGNPLSQSTVGAGACKAQIGPAAMRLRAEGKGDLAARLLAGAMALHLDEPRDQYELDPAYGGQGSGFEAWTGAKRADVQTTCDAEIATLEAGPKEHWSKTPKSAACHACAQGVKGFCISPDGRVMRKTYHYVRTRTHAHAFAGTLDPDAGTGSPLPGWNDTGKNSRRPRAEDAAGEEGVDEEVPEE